MNGPTLLFCWLLVRLVSAQTPVTTLSGRVLDAQTNQPLPFASVYLNNTTHGTTADEHGNYRLTNVPLGSQELVGSMLGYMTVRHPLRLADTRARVLTFKLHPTAQLLATVTVTAPRDAAWQRQFALFSRELLGTHPLAGQCRITNPNVLSFEQKNGRLLVRATEPLVIENRALGYMLYYDLSFFELIDGQMNFAGTSHFEEIEPDSAEKRAHWQANRLAAYRGSLHHLLASLLTGTHEQEGYLVYFMDEAPLMAYTDHGRPRQRLTDKQAGALFRPGRLPTERRLVSNRALEVFYKPVGTQADAAAVYSVLRLPKKWFELTTTGWITQGNGLDVRGHMGNDRLATLLPADWVPNFGE